MGQIANNWEKYLGPEIGVSHFFTLTSVSAIFHYNGPTSCQESLLKSILLTLSSFFICSMALADLSLEHVKNCEAFKDVTDAGGSCRIVVLPKKLEKQGICVGLFNGSLPCVVSYISVKEGAAMNLFCGSEQNPVVDQDMEAEAIEYRVVTQVTQPDGKIQLIKDPKTYQRVGSAMVTLNLSSEAPEILFALQAGEVPLTNVQCH